MSETSTSRTANIAVGFGIAGPGVTMVGIGVSQAGATPMTGFLLFQLGILCGLVGFILGLVGIFLTRGGVGGRSRAATAFGLGVLMVLVVLVSASPGAGVPPINDITTNLDDPPAFAPAPAGHRNAGRDMGYPPDWKPLVRDAYPDLTPIRVAVSPQQAYDIAVAEAEALGWEITRRDDTTFEAQATTALFRFVDDVSVRIAADASGQAVIDIRSKSRDGRGDLGANAGRMRAFSARVLARIEGA